MTMQRCGWSALPLLLAAGLSACGGGGDSDDVAATPSQQSGQSGQSGQAEQSTCPAAQVAAWRVSIRYSGELGASSPDGKTVFEHQVMADLSALLTMQHNRSAAGENWSPAGNVTQQMREYVDGELTMQAEGAGPPVAGNSSSITDSRILLSIYPPTCTYFLYSSGTVMSQIIHGAKTDTGPASYGTVIIRNQPATLSISESRKVPVLEASFDPQVEMPDLYIPSIGTQAGDGVLVSWQLEPVEP